MREAALAVAPKTLSIRDVFTTRHYYTSVAVYLSKLTT